jgi:serine protease Do
MDRSLPHQSASRTKTRRLAYASALAALALAGVVGLGIPQSAVHAQLKPEAAIQMPGRAPLSFADIVERVKPAVVSIHVTNGGSQPKVAQAPKGGSPKGSSPRDLFPGLPDDHPLSEFFKNLPKEWRDLPGPGNPRPTQAQGSGFVVSADGFVVTNNHVIDGGSKIQVSFDKDNKFDAELIGTDQRTDIALLKIKASQTFPFVKFADKTPRVGDWVIAVGNPFGLGGTVTAGIVSAQGRDIGSGPYDYMQIDAAVNRGNSGGPTFNLDGDVVGVNTAIYSPSGGNVGIAFAIPAKTAGDVVTQLKSSGSVNRGWLGVKIQNIDEDTAASLGLTEPKGALVTEVTTPGPAAEAGLKNGDAILSVNGSAVADSRDLARQIAGLLSQRQGRRAHPARPEGADRSPSSSASSQSGKELAKVESGKPDDPAQRRSTELDQLGLTVAPGSRPQQGRRGRHRCRQRLRRGSEGHQVGRRDLEVGGLSVKNPEDLANGIKEADQARAQGRAGSRQVRRADALRCRPAEEELIPLS